MFQQEPLKKKSPPLLSQLEDALFQCSIKWLCIMPEDLRCTLKPRVSEMSATVQPRWDPLGFKMQSAAPLMSPCAPNGYKKDTEGIK